MAAGGPATRARATEAGHEQHRPPAEQEEGAVVDRSGPGSIPASSCAGAGTDSRRASSAKGERCVHAGVKGTCPLGCFRCWKDGASFPSVAPWLTPPSVPTRPRSCSPGPRPFPATRGSGIGSWAPGIPNWSLLPPCGGPHPRLDAARRPPCAVALAEGTEGDENAILVA